MLFKSLIRFTAYLYRNFPRSSFAYICITLVSALLDASTVLLVAPIFDLLMSNNQPQAENTSLISQYIMDLVTQLGLPQTALMMMVLFWVIVLVRNVFLIASDIFSVYIKERTVARLKVSVFNSVLQANWKFYLEGHQGNFLNVLTREIVLTQNAFVQFSHVISYALQVSLFIGVALWVSWQLTLTCVSIGFVLIVPFVLLMKWNYRWGASAGTYATELNGILQESFSMAKVIQTFQNQPVMLDRLRSAQDQLFKKTSFSQSLTFFIQHSYYPLGLLTVVLGYYISIKMALTFSELSIILFAMWKSMPALSSLMRVLSQLSETIPSFGRILDLQQKAEKSKMQSGQMIFGGLKQKIALKNFSFSYDANGKHVLNDVNFELPKGKMVALVGHSGSGKSTLVDIIMGFYSNYQGQFWVDSTPFAELDIYSYRKKIGYVPQNSMLFNTSIYNNFIWLHPELTEADIRWACEKAHALEFIESLDRGFETIVGERGVRLSGGQVQRLALARAIAHKPELLILDEATSALDSESETYIQKSIESLAHEMTILVIAHRLSTIKKADYIYVFSQGQVIEEGSMQDLESRSSVFKNMLRQQNLTEQETKKSN